MATIFSATLVPRQKLNQQVRFDVTAVTSTVGLPGLIEKSLNFSTPGADVDHMDTTYTYTLTIARA